MTPILHTILDSMSFAEAVKGHVDVREELDISGFVPHAGFGGATKSSYVSPKTGKTVYVLERSGLYAPDAWTTHVWQFDADFTADEAAAFLSAQDAVARS